MQLRFKIIIVFILSLIVSVIAFLAIFGILIATPFSGGYSEKDMNLAANAISAAIASLPEIDQQHLAPIFSKWQKKYPNMTFTIATDSKILFSTAKKGDTRGVSPDVLMKIAKFPGQLSTLEQQSPDKKDLLEQVGETTGLPTIRQLPQGKTLGRASSSTPYKQVMIFSNHVKPSSSLRTNNLFLYTYQQNNTAERILAREIQRPNKSIAFLTITVNSKFYTAIELFTDPRKAGVIIAIFMIGLGFTIIFTSIFAVVFTRNISRRFNRLYNGIDSFELGNLNVGISDRANDEIGRIAATFNRMTEKIRQQFHREQAYQEQRRQLISDVSHDLRTPLTAIIGYAESLENRVYENPVEQRNFAGIIRKKALYMEKLLGELLEFSKMESDNFKLQITEIDLAELTREIIIEYLPLIKEEAIVLQADIPELPVLVNVDANRISRALRNLIDNALKYGSQGKFLQVAVSVTESAAIINVGDHGPGINEAEQAKIFDRCYRIDKGRNSASGGTGLGLSIAWEIVRKHGGQIRVQSEKDAGTVFTVELPLQTPR